METQYINNLGVKTEIPQEKIKYVLYARKSTESDEKQALSIDLRVKEMLTIADRDNLEVVDIRRESHSAKESGGRPVFKEVLEDIRRGRYTGILTWAPDRLSRNAGDLGAIVDLLDRNALLEVRTYGQTFSNNPNEKFLLMILGSQAKLENDQKGVNVKRGMRARCEQGLWPAPAPTGYLKYKEKDRLCECYVDPDRGFIVKVIFEKFVHERWPGRDIHIWLKDDLKFRTTGNKPLTLSGVFKILNTPFYYGEFEYPKKSGRWYKGKHEPLITKELYMQAQQRLSENRHNKSVKRNNFAFTRIMKCGKCGSGISAQEKYKTLKNGKVNKHIYYSCSKGKDRFCRNKYLPEHEVIKQISEIIEDLDLDKVNLGYKIQQELERYSHFQSKVLGITEIESKKKKEVDIKNYAKYLLEEGTIVEKRELLENLKSKLMLLNKQISLIK